MARVRQPKVGGALGKTALEVAIAITEQIRKPREGAAATAAQTNA